MGKPRLLGKNPLSVESNERDGKHNKRSGDFTVGYQKTNLRALAQETRFNKSWLKTEIGETPSIPGKSHRGARAWLREH